MSTYRMSDVARHELKVTSKHRASPILEWTKMTSRTKEPFFMPPSGGASVPPHNGEPIRRHIPSVAMDSQVGREFYTKEQRDELEAIEAEREAARRLAVSKPKLMYGPSAEELEKRKEAEKRRTFLKEAKSRHGKEIGRHCGVNMSAGGGRSESPGAGGGGGGPALLLGPDDLKPFIPGGSFSKAGLKEGRSAHSASKKANLDNTNGLIRPLSAEEDDDMFGTRSGRSGARSLPNLGKSNANGGALNNTNITTLTKGCTISRAVQRETPAPDRPDLNVNIFSVKPNTNANVSIDFKRMASRASPIPGGTSSSLCEKPKMSDKYRALFKKYQRSDVAVDRTHFKVRPRLSPLETRGTSKRSYSSCTRRSDDIAGLLHEADNACKRATSTMSLYFENPKTRSESRSALFYNTSPQGGGMGSGMGGDDDSHYHYSNMAPTDNGEVSFN